MHYYFSKHLAGSFDDAIGRVTEALQKEGFGIITEIDLKEKFREKLGVDFRNYRILGACNPGMAYKAVQQEPNIGIMLPCNVLVQEHENGQVDVVAINPIQSIGAIQNDNLKAIAGEISGKLKKVIDQL